MEQLKKKSIDEGIVKNYAELIPKEMREAIQVLSTDQRWAIYNALYFERRMNFTKIKELFKANPNTITCALRALMEGGLIIRSTRKLEDSFDNNKVFYEVSPMGEKFLTSLFEIVYPESESKAQDIPTIYDNTSSSPQNGTTYFGEPNRNSQLGLLADSKISIPHQKWDKTPTDKDRSTVSLNGVR